MKKCIELADHINEVFELHLKGHTETSSFVRLFWQLLTEQEVETALLLSAESENCQQISQRTGLSKEVLEKNLKSLVQKGIIYEEKEEGTDKYHLLPFVPGIFESVGAMLNSSELAEYLDGYIEEMKSLKKEYTGYTIPVNQKVEIEISSMTIEELMPYLNGTDHFAKMDCICRSIQKERGKACGHPIKDMCMIFGDFAEYYIRIGAAERATRQKIIELLIYAEQQGLYHEVYPIEKSKSAFVCNCCSCGCRFMGLANRIRHAVHFRQKILIDREKCNQCGKCIDFCPEQVFQWSAGKIEVNPENCFQCGGCKVVCERSAIKIE